MIDFELLFDKLWVLFKVHYFALRFKIALAPFFEMAILLPLNCFCLFLENQLAVIVWGSFRVLYSVSFVLLIYVFMPQPIPHCPDY